MSRFWGQFINIQSKEKKELNEDYSGDDRETENDKGVKSQMVFSIWPHF